jgi:hypothetical protein
MTLLAESIPPRLLSREKTAELADRRSGLCISRLHALQAPDDRVDFPPEQPVLCP